MKTFIIVAAFLGLSACWVQQGLTETCDHFVDRQIVVTYDGMTGLVMDYKGEEGKCYYKVRGQRGTEMPTVDWYRPNELDTEY